MNIRVYVLLLLLATAIGCAQRPIRITTACTPHTTTELITALTSLVASEGMSVTLVNENVGILQASSPELTSILTGTSSNHWTFTVKDGRIDAYAKSIYKTTNKYGATVSSSEYFYSDKEDRDTKWYWNVRNGLQRLCGDSIAFVEQ